MMSIKPEARTPYLPVTTSPTHSQHKTPPEQGAGRRHQRLRYFLEIGSSYKQ